MHLNSIVVCTPTPIFIGIYRVSEREDGKYLLQILRDVIDGPLLKPHKKKVAAIVTDNGPAIKWARNKLAEEHLELALRRA